MSRNTEHAMLFTLPGNKFKFPDFLEPGLDVIIDEDEAYSRFGRRVVTVVVTPIWTSGESAL